MFSFMAVSQQNPFPLSFKKMNYYLKKKKSSQGFDDKLAYIFLLVRKQVSATISQKRKYYACRTMGIHFSLESAKWVRSMDGQMVR